MSNHTTTNNTDLIALSEFQPFLFHPLVPLKDLQDFEHKPMQKIVPYQRRYGLLPFVDKGRWQRLSFAPLLWVLFPGTLRQMGYPREKPKAVCAYFFKDACKHHLPQQDFSTKHHSSYMFKKRKHQNTCKSKSGDRHIPVSCPLASSSLAHLKNTFQ